MLAPISRVTGSHTRGAPALGGNERLGVPCPNLICSGSSARYAWRHHNHSKPGDSTLRQPHQRPFRLHLLIHHHHLPPNFAHYFTVFADVVAVVDVVAVALCHPFRDLPISTSSRDSARSSREGRLRAISSDPLLQLFHPILDGEEKNNSE